MDMHPQNKRVWPLFKMRYKKIAIIGILVILFSIFINSLNLSSISISPVNATTSSNLSCYFTVSGHTQVNVSWYNNSVLFRTTINSTSPDVLSHTYTKKGQKWNCTVRAENSTDLTFDIESSRITIQNSPPTTPFLKNSSNINIGSYETLTEGYNYSFTLQTTDADSDTLIYSKSFITGDDYCTINSGSGIVTCSPEDEPDLSINDEYDFLVRDGTNIVGMSIEFNVTPVNDVPYFITSIANQSVEENETLQYIITVGDEENSTGPFLFSVNSSYNPERIENTTANEYIFTIQFFDNRKANYTDEGNHTVTITACDPEDNALCVSDSFNLEVISINHAPEIEVIPNKSGVQNQRFTLRINASDVDPDQINFSITEDCGLNIWNLTTIEHGNENATALINVTLNNTHIYCANFTVYITDTKVTVSQNVYLNLSNRNDNPLIHRNSLYSGNYLDNKKINNLTAYTDIRFVYRINATDMDSLVNFSESLSYATNSSNCLANCPHLSINSSTGTVTFMPNSSFTGNYYYLITVTDDGGKTDTEIFNITILQNYPPYFNQVPQNQTAYEDSLFTYKINATDPDGAFDTFIDNSSFFVISSSGLINFTPNCSIDGNYSVYIRINDTNGGENSSIFTLEIQNTADAPILPNVLNSTIIESYLYYLDIGSQTTDPDTTCFENDNKTFTSRFIGSAALFNISANGIISFTPNSTADGEYRINVTVRDLYGLTDSVLFNITIINRTYAPIIQNITPYDRPINTSFVLVSSIGENYTYTNTTENTTIYFAHETYDPDGDQLEYNWTLDGSIVSSSRNYSRYFGFAENGTYTVVLIVYDNVSGLMAHDINFTWYLTIHNKNRIPLLNSSLPNVTNITQAFRWTNYLTGGSGNVRFNDPDNDTLTYTNTETTKVDIEYDGNDVIFTPLAVGSETVIFTADDGTDTKISNNVTINVTEIPESDTPQSSSTRTRKKSVPYPVFEQVEVEKEVFLDILNPEPAVIYNNNTLRQKIVILNSGNKTLHGIKLSALTNSSTADITFSNVFLANLEPNSEEKVDLIVKDYRLYNNYVITIYANVTSPFYKDKAVIYINALEKSKGDDTLTQTKITFAKDLLSSNPECMELNEYLKKALEHTEQGNYEEAQIIIDSVIQGCKNLVSKSKLKNDSPLAWAIKISEIPYFRPILISFIVLAIFAVFITIRAKRINEQNEA